MGELAAVHKRIKVGKDDTLWCAGGATCIGDVDDVHLGVDLDLWGRRLVTGDELAEVSCTFRDRSFTQHLHGSRYGRVVVGQAHYYGVLYRRAGDNLLGHRKQEVQPDKRLDPRVVQL